MNHNNKIGFTIVELLVVIAVIAILVAITVVSYGNVQKNARDTIRLDDISRIRGALELYKSQVGTYPAANPDPATWERSTTNPTGFLSGLQSYIGNVPVDPKNTGTSYYFYYRYPSGNMSYSNCPAIKGDFYVLGINTMETKSGITSSPGWNCDNGSYVPTNSTWVTTAARAVWGGFAN